MNSDIRIDTGFTYSTKLKKLERALDHDAVGWHLICLWSWVALHRPTGDLSGLNEDDIERAACWNSVRGLLVTTLVEHGWLDAHDGGAMVIHDWREHQPYVLHAPMRRRAAKIAAKARWRRVDKCVAGQQVNADRNANRNAPYEKPHHAPSPSPIPEEGEASGVQELLVPPDAPKVQVMCTAPKKRAAPLALFDEAVEPIPEPAADQRSPRKRKRGTEAFDVWWEAYREGIAPRPMRDRDACLEKWIALKLTPEEERAMVTKLDAQVDYRKRYAGRRDVLIPNLPDPIRYFKRKMWRAEIPR